MKKKKLAKQYGGYLYIAPWVVGFTALTLIPFICLVYFSFTKYNMLTAPEWIGIQNYVDIFKGDRKFIDALKVTFTYVLTSVPLKLIVALLVAMALNQKRKGIGIYRTLFYIPSIIGGSVAVAVMWRNLFSRDGAFNALLEAITGLDVNISWVADPNTALGSLVLMAVWQFGSPMLIFLAGLKNISTTYYEAARVDGANKVQCFFSITLPLLSPIIFFNLIMEMINVFMTFTQGLVVTNGGPMNRTLFYQLYVYQQGFERFNMGYASALSCVLLVIVLFFTALAFKSSDAWVYYESGGKR